MFMYFFHQFAGNYPCHAVSHSDYCVEFRNKKLKKNIQVTCKILFIIPDDISYKN